MIINDNEIYRYAGFRQNIPDATVLGMINEIKTEVEKRTTPVSIYKEVEFSKKSDSVIVVQGLEFESRKLVSHLRNSDRLIVFAATLGVESDMIIRKYISSDSAKAVIAQAVLAAAIESYCDESCEKISEQVSADGYYLRPRFSPGYADFQLTDQKKIFSILDISKRIGITLTDECLMSPSKSVTAFIGLTTDDECNFNKCAYCGKADCEFRRTI